MSSSGILQKTLECEWCHQKYTEDTKADLYIRCIAGVMHTVCGNCLDNLQPLYPENVASDVVLEDSDTFHMNRENWDPLIDAMKHLSNIPVCGDVATKLHDIFVSAKKGKYYFVEIGHEDMEGRCFVKGIEGNEEGTMEPERV
jgi:hypothetical protein